MQHSRFEAEESGTPEAPRLWLYSDDSGEPENVIAFALRCAQAFSLTGLWGFRWALTASKPTLDGFGGGAHVLDLGRRETVAWLDCDTWLAEQLAVREAQPARAEALLQPVAAAQGWSMATQTGVLLDFIDGLITDDPGIADRLQAHLAMQPASRAPIASADPSPGDRCATAAAKPEESRARRFALR